MSRSVGLLRAAALFAAALLAHAAVAQSTLAPVTVVRVVDGDTVDVQLEDGRTERVRLIGIDTPEVVDPRTPVQCFGREASTHAHELLDGQPLSLELDPGQGERDAFGRLLAYLWLPDGRNFGEAMIADGYAHGYTYNQPYAYQQAFRAAQAVAISKQAGLWSPATCNGDTTQPADQPVLTAPPPDPAPAQTGAAGLRPGFDPMRYIGQATATTARRSAPRPRRRPYSGLTRGTRTGWMPIVTK